MIFSGVLDWYTVFRSVETQVHRLCQRADGSLTYVGGATVRLGCFTLLMVMVFWGGETFFVYHGVVFGRSGSSYQGSSARLEWWGRTVRWRDSSDSIDGGLCRSGTWFVVRPPGV